MKAKNAVAGLPVKVKRRLPYGGQNAVIKDASLAHLDVVEVLLCPTSLYPVRVVLPLGSLKIRKKK